MPEIPDVTRRRQSRRLQTTVTISALLLLAACSPNASPNAVYSGDFPDPSIIRVATTYYAFATQGASGHPAIQRLTSSDRVHWTVPAQPDALQALPVWADDSGTWSPIVRLIGQDYVMYYSAHEAGGHHCLTFATAASPADQFVDHSRKPLLCLPGGETIDPSTFIGIFGERYLQWKGPDSKGVATLFSQRVSADGQSLLGRRSQLLRAKPKGWPSHNIEAPSMIFAAGKYFLFYSGGNYWTSKYAMGYAVCSGPLGPCSDKSATKPWVGTHRNARGPGGESFFFDSTGSLFIAYHAWGSRVGYSNGGIRSLWIDRVSFLYGVPVFGCFAGCP